MQQSEKITRTAYIWTQILNTPIWALFNMFQYIIYKDLNATALQIALIITLKPVVSLFSIYWGSAVYERRDRLLPNIIWGRVLSAIPFFFFPFVDNIWFFIATFGFYMMLARGTTPAWMEILKINTPTASRAKLFASGAFAGHIGNCLFPFAIGWVLDDYFQSWRWLFPITALLSLTSIALQLKIPIDTSIDQNKKQKLPTPAITSIPKAIISPWQNGLKLMREQKEFTKYQLGFMLGGAGMMISQPALPQFFIDVLNLSYTEMAIALNCCKGIGYLLTAPAWAHYFSNTNIFRFSAYPPLWICLFSALLLLAPYHIIFLYFAYICYGITQAGGDLSWNLSGTVFAGESNSAPYSNVNVLTVGLRGCIVPPLGSYLFAHTTSPFIIALGGLLSLFSNRALLFFERSSQTLPKEEAATAD